VSERIVIGRAELFTADVERALERERRLAQRELPEPPPLPRWRRILLSSMFYLPAAGALACLGAWLLVEPFFDDLSTIGGEVVLVNTDPFDVDVPGAVALTVGTGEVVVLPETVMEPGADGQPPFSSLSAITPGTVLEAAGSPIGAQRMIAIGVRPATREAAAATGQEIAPELTAAHFLLFPLTAVALALAMLAAEGIASRHWLRLAERAAVGVLLTLVFTVVAYVPAGLCIAFAEAVALPDLAIYDADDFGALQFLTFAAGRSAAWAWVGAALGLGMSLYKGTAVQRRNALTGGALGGALGGVFFDPIDRFLTGASAFGGGDLSRLVGLAAVGVAVGIFVALVDRLAREAWILVRTGPLAGKSFVLYRNPTVVGSAPQADIYLFKDAEIEPRHLAIHRVGNAYEVEDLGTRAGTQVEGATVRQRRLRSGDRIVVGSTALDFEERTRKRPRDRGREEPERSAS
jgi:hypothetical protein